MRVRGNFPTVRWGIKALTPHRYQKSHSILVRISRFRCALTGTFEFFPVESTDKCSGLKL